MAEVAIITGGTKGLGKAAVDRFLQEGWLVATCARSLDGLPPNENLLAVAIDITDPDAVQGFVRAVCERWGRIDVLINNAGILGPRVVIEDYPIDDWQQVVAADLSAAFYFAKSVAPIMRQQRSGVIVNISSGAGIKGKARWGAYAAAKFGLEGFTQVLRDELAEHRIRVHAFDPGAMRTDMRQAAYHDEDPEQNPHPDRIARVLFDVVAVFEPQLGRLAAKDYL